MISHCLNRPNETQDHWKQQESVSHTEQYNTEPHFVEDLENVGLRWSKDRKRNKGREAPVEDGRAHFA